MGPAVKPQDDEGGRQPAQGPRDLAQQKKPAAGGAAGLSVRA